MKRPSPTKWKGWMLLWLVSFASGQAQTDPQFTDIRRLTNKEIRLQLNAPAGRGYRIDTSTNLPEWTPMITFTSATATLVHTDCAAPFLSSRYYRAEQLNITNLLTGDHLATTNGDLVIHPVNHASFVMSWNGMMIYSDPVGGGALYTNFFPRADLILVTHNHGDHFEAATLGAVLKPDGYIIAPAGVYNHATMTPTLRSRTSVITYGVTTNLLGLTVEAVLATNANHTFGVNNAYVVSLGGKRIFISGDTGNTPHMRALTDIDVAFLCMNIPFTMNIFDATNCVRAMRPKVVYPYHYRDSSGSTTNAAAFKQVLGLDPGIEVRLRKWY